MEHIKEYNKSWDFYRGLSVNQIENSMRNDTVWDRPSWPLKGKYKNVFDDDFTAYDDVIFDNNNEKFSKNYFNNTLVNETLTKEENEAINNYTYYASYLKR